jgi:hypothetical protein
VAREEEVVAAAVARVVEVVAGAAVVAEEEGREVAARAPESLAAAGTPGMAAAVQARGAPGTVPAAPAG